jgi:tetratricopeptide (TPR) repeat protein
MYSNEGNYNKAIACLKHELDTAENKRQKHNTLWHLGQMYACKNDYDTAILFMKKATHLMTYFIDKQFYWYYRGTIAFLKRDKEKLQKYYRKLWPYRDGYYRKNALMLKKLYDDFEKPYAEIFQVQRLNQIPHGI